MGLQRPHKSGSCMPRRRDSKAGLPDCVPWRTIGATPPVLGRFATCASAFARLRRDKSGWRPPIRASCRCCQDSGLHPLPTTKPTKPSPPAISFKRLGLLQFLGGFAALRLCVQYLVRGDHKGTGPVARPPPTPIPTNHSKRHFRVTRCSGSWLNAFDTIACLVCALTQTYT